MSTSTKSPARVKAEKSIYDLFDALDHSGYNSGMYKELFSTMNDTEFKSYMRDLYEERQYVYMEVDTAKRELTMDKIFKACEKIGFETHKYIKYRDSHESNGESAITVTTEPILILYMPIKRLQQMLSKKNSASGDIDKINPMTGTVTSDSKSAGINDTQTFGLITTGQTEVIKELLGPRADDERSKKQMLHMIEERGDVSLRDLNIDVKNKQSVNTMKVFLRSVNIDVEIV